MPIKSEEAFEKIRRYGQERREALALAEQRLERGMELIPTARDEGYSMEQIAEALHLSRQQIYKRWAG